MTNSNDPKDTAARSTTGTDTAVSPAVRDGGETDARRETSTDAKGREKRPLKEKVSAALSSASTEHRANARPEDAPAPARSGRSPRRARLRLTRLDPWSVMKTAFLLSIALAVVTVVSVLIVYGVLGLAGVWDSINETVRNVIGGEDSASFDVNDYIGLSRVLGFTLLVSVIDIILVTAIATLMAFLYNMAAALLGGIEVTLAEDD